jgi:hypothetical protein
LEFEHIERGAMTIVSVRSFLKDLRLKMEFKAVSKRSPGPIRLTFYYRDELERYAKENNPEGLFELFKLAREYKRCSKIDFEDILSHLFLLSRAGVYENFCNLSAKNREVFDEYVVRYVSPESLRNLFVSFELAGKPKPFERKYYGPIDTLSSLKEMSDSLLSSIGSSDEVSQQYADCIFNYLWNNYETQNFFAATALYMRLAFGEEAVIGAINLFNRENVELNEDVALRIAENWDELKDSPLTWCLTILEMEDKMQV